MIHTFPFQWLLILTLSAQIKGYQMTNQLEISAGHVFPLECTHEEQNVEVRWSSEKELNFDMDSLPAGIKIIKKSLWFFPAEPSHSGNYSCTFWYNNSSNHTKRVFSIAVANWTIPTVTRHVVRGTSTFLSCDLGHISKILQIDPGFRVTWIKDGSNHSKDFLLRFLNVDEKDSGEYTCLVNFTHEGNLYTAAQIFQLSVSPGVIAQIPRVLSPQQDIHTVQIGSRHELKCKAFVGTDEDDFAEPTTPYWIVGNKYASTYPKHFVIKNGCTTKDSTIYCSTNLTILEVQKEFLHIPFMCVVLNSKGFHNGTVTLIPASPSYWVVALVAYVVLALGLLMVHLFKVDLVLAYRKLSPCLKRQCDGKLYDAYVSYFHGNYQSISFALRTLPEVMEDHLGYKLFISSRDELPGTAVPDVIAETVGKCRRLIIILSSQACTKPTYSATEGLMQEMSAEHLSLNNNGTEVYPHLSDPAETNELNWGPYEWWVGLYDALVKGGLQVILVQVGEEVDEAQLPESLRYLKRTQGILRWKQDYTTKPNGKFWKQLRYRMPLVQKGKVSAVV
ncbi:interleukin-1 receptor-like 2 [Salminus brasiliensis]|uniref:interleukin-1 receptor-like 2 n=1 Tax=Salminus brasiliensis TaxID=930266 RepID=UPI003B82D51E